MTVTKKEVVSKMPQKEKEEALKVMKDSNYWNTHKAYHPNKPNKGERSIDYANRTAKKVDSIFKNKDYLGTSKGSKNYKN